MVHTVNNDAGPVTEIRSCPAGLDPAVVVRFDEKKNGMRPASRRTVGPYVRVTRFNLLKCCFRQYRRNAEPRLLRHPRSLIVEMPVRMPAAGDDFSLGLLSCTVGV
jgi:hypothetical protein